jgi:hypothetical protein
MLGRARISFIPVKAADFGSNWHRVQRVIHALSQRIKRLKRDADRSFRHSVKVRSYISALVRPRASLYGQLLSDADTRGSVPYPAYDAAGCLLPSLPSDPLAPPRRPSASDVT